MSSIPTIEHCPIIKHTEENNKHCTEHTIVKFHISSRKILWHRSCLLYIDSGS